MKQKYTERLPMIRVNKKTYKALMAITEAQEMKLSEVVRAALQEYVIPNVPKSFPIVGILENGKVKLYRREVKEVKPGGPYLETEPIIARS